MYHDPCDPHIDPDPYVHVATFLSALCSPKPFKSSVAGPCHVARATPESRPHLSTSCWALLYSHNNHVATSFHCRLSVPSVPISRKIISDPKLALAVSESAFRLIFPPVGTSIACTTIITLLACRLTCLLDETHFTLDHSVSDGQVVYLLSPRVAP